MKMEILNLVAFVGLMFLAGCGDSSSSSSSFGMLGFKLGQEIDYMDKAVVRSLGITKVEKDDDGSISCEFKSNHPFRKFNKGSLTIDSRTQRIYIISSIIEGDEGDMLDIAKESDIVSDVMKEKFGGKWKKSRDEYGTSFDEGDLGGGVTASVIFDNGRLGCRCHIILRNSKVIKDNKKRNLKSNVDLF